MFERKLQPNQEPNEDGSFNMPAYTPTDWEQAVAVCEWFGAKVVLPTEGHSFGEDSHCSKCDCYGPNEESLPCVSNWEFKLRKLAPNWDGEDAPIPSDAAISAAKEIGLWLEQNNLTPDSIEADVIGGVDIYLSNSAGDTAWICILNSGHKSIILSDVEGSSSTGQALDLTSLQQMKTHLQHGGLVALEGKTIQGTINDSGDWEPMVSVPMSEYEELVKKAEAYDNAARDLLELAK
jgi:hypothetical protein